MNNDLRILNQLLETYCMESGLKWVDLNKLFCPKGFLAKEYTIDDIHLNGKAYKMMADVLRPYLN